MALGNYVSGNSNGKYNWCSYIDIWENADASNDDKVSLHIELGYWTRYAIDVYASGHLDPNDTNWSGSLQSWNNSDWVKVAVTSTNVDVWREANDKTYSCNGRIWTTGGFAPGTSWCSGSYTVKAHPRYKPDKPTNLTVESSTDTAQKLKVTLPEKTGWKLYDNVNFYRHTDNGDTEQLYHGTPVSNYTDSTTTAGHKYTYDCRVQNGDSASLLSDQSNVVTIYTSPTALGRLELIKTAENKAQLKGYDAPRWCDGYQFQVTKDNGKTWKDVTLTSDWVDANAPAGTIVYRARAYKLKPVNGAGDTIYSPWTSTNSITTICPPNAPAINGIKSVYAANNDRVANIAFTWTPNHPDGSTQTAAQIAINVSAGTTAPITVQGAATSYTLTNIGIGDVSIRVRTKGLDAEWGAWSEWKSTKVAKLPQAYFTSPSTNALTVDKLPFTVTWEVNDPTGVSYQKIELINNGYGTMAYIEPSTNTRSWNFDKYAMLPNRRSFTLKGTVRNGAGLTIEFTRTFSTSWLTPAAPSIKIEYTPNLSAVINVRASQTEYSVEGTALTGPITQNENGVLLSGKLTIENGAIKLASTAPSVSFDISRRNPDNSLTPLETNKGIGTGIIDPLPPLNTNFVYVVTARSEAGTYITFNVHGFCDSDGDEAFNFGDSANECLRVGFDAQASRSKKVSGNTIHFALGKGASPLPMFYSNDDLDIDGSHSYKIHSLDAYRRAELITDKPENAVCYFRSAFGRIARVYVSAWNFSYAAENYMLWNMGAKLTECVWEEPLR